MLLKGPATVVAAPDGDVLVVVTDGDARLATAGTGDVLSGIIGALLASRLDAVRRGGGRRLDPRRAAVVAGPPTGLVAGDLARVRSPRCWRRLS